MTITIVGGGPGGLYLAILMKRASAAHRITVFERDAAGETFGWGVAFAAAALDTIRATDEPTWQALGRHSVSWRQLAVVHQTSRITVPTEPFAGISRAMLVGVLRDRAAAVGVDLRFQAAVHDVRALPNADLLVGADGANSLVRRTFAEGFAPRLQAGTNVYAWLGVHHRVDALTVAFRSSAAGTFVAHAHPFSATESSVVVECSEATWTRAGLDGRSDPDACNYLSDVFAAEFDGHLLRADGPVRWKPFLLVDNGHWHYEHIVLLGDALHTVHFSTGSGTRLALDDAIALAASLTSHADLDRALEAFEAAHRKATAARMAQARASLAWFEHADRHLALTPHALAYRTLVETGRFEASDLAERAPDLAARAGVAPNV